ncbi:hypothetical protein TNCV_4450361 [Trichonephila clavipes]|nr:hypothetical protein TNCV_4450361 [Trichonephila clavipes]
MDSPPHRTDKSLILPVPPSCRQQCLGKLLHAFQVRDVCEHTREKRRFVSSRMGDSERCVCRATATLTEIKRTFEYRRFVPTVR